MANNAEQDSKKGPGGAATKSGDHTRRGFFAAATAAIGVAIGAVLAYPIVRYVLFPVGRKTVTGATGAIDVLAESERIPGGAPIKVQLIGSGVRNAWAVADDVAMGSAWLQKNEEGVVQAFSSVCPHLGCAIDYDNKGQSFKCPCHRSAFSLSGDRKSGPSKRGLDPLPTDVDDGRVKVTFKRFKQDIAQRKEV